MQAANHHQSASSFTNLLIRYMDGQIGDRSWKKLMKSFDQGGLSKAEKQAFARFMNEVIADAPSVDLHVPRPEEMAELLAEVRHQRH